jgi:hypothetical protein
MISVAAGVTIGLFVSQVIGMLVHFVTNALLSLTSVSVYLFGSRKNAAHFAF